MKRTFLIFLLTLAAIFLLVGCRDQQEQDEVSQSQQRRLEMTAVADPIDPVDGPDISGIDSPEPATPAVLARSDVIMLEIIPGESAARFEIEEDLRGELTGWGLPARFTVEGSTNQVTGRATLDFENLSTLTFGKIRIDASTFETDNVFRNRAIRERILQSERHPYVVFQPTRVTNLPDRLEVGDTSLVRITGDLTILDNTLEKSVVVSITRQSENQIAGGGSMTISREEFGLTIPNTPNVTFVADDVDLYIDFVARAP